MESEEVALARSTGWPIRLFWQPLHGMHSCLLFLRRLSQQHREEIRFCLLFSLYAALVFLVLYWLQDQVVVPLSRRLALLIQDLLGRANIRVPWSVSAAPNLAGEITSHCSIIYEMGFYAAAVWACPARTDERVAGVLLGAVVFTLLNLLCVPSLFYLGLYLPGLLTGWSPEAHVYVWQAVVLALGAIVWFSWASWVRQSRRSLWRALLLRSALAFVLLTLLWGVVAPGYAYLLTAVGRPLGLLLEEIGRAHV